MGIFGSLLGGILGGASSIKTGRDNEKMIQQMRQDDQKFNVEQWDKASQYNRPNQSSDFGNLTWSKDANGNWTQSNMLAAPEAARLQDFRQMAANRMHAANQIDFTKPMTYDTTPYQSKAAQNWNGKTGLSGFDPFAAFSSPSADGAALGGGGAPPQQPAPPIAGPSAGGAALGSPSNPAPIVPPGMQQPGAAPPPQQVAPPQTAQGPASDMDAIWAEMQKRKALEDNLWALNSQNSSPGQ